MKKDILENFWIEWLEANEDERIRLVQKTMIAKELSEHLTLKLAKAKVQNKFIKEMAARNINDYFQDLEQVIASKKQNAEMGVASSLKGFDKLIKKTQAFAKEKGLKQADVDNAVKRARE